jgi:hypothetical protein
MIGVERAVDQKISTIRSKYSSNSSPLTGSDERGVCQINRQVRILASQKADAANIGGPKIQQPHVASLYPMEDNVCRTAVTLQEVIRFDNDRPDGIHRELNGPDGFRARTMKLISTIDQGQDWASVNRDAFFVIQSDAP